MWIVILLAVIFLLSLLYRGARHSALYATALEAAISNYITSANEYVMDVFFRNDLSSHCGSAFASGLFNHKKGALLELGMSPEGRLIMGYLVDLALSAHCLIQHCSIHGLNIRDKDLKHMFGVLQNHNELLQTAYEDFLELAAKREDFGQYKEELTPERFAQALNIMESSL